MTHLAHDPFLDAASPIHRLDARTKILAVFALIAICVSTPASAWVAFAGYLGLLGCALAASRLPLWPVLRRSLAVIPFVLLVAIFIPFQKAHGGGGYSLGIGTLAISRSGALVFWNILIKAWIGALGMALLTASTDFPRLLQGLDQLRVPRLLIVLASFTYRYLFVLGDEVQRMRRACVSRGYRGAFLWQSKVIGQMIGTLFLRSYERGERVYQAMVSRGFEGRPAGLGRTRLRALDYAAGLGVAGVLILLRVACA